MGWLASRRRSGILPAGGGSNWWKKALLDHAVVAAGDRGTVHVTAEKQSLLAPWMAGLDERRARRSSVPPAAPLPPHVQAQLMPGAVVVHAPSMWPYKQWPLAHFEALVNGAAGARPAGGADRQRRRPRDQECIAPLRALAPAAATAGPFGPARFQPAGDAVARRRALHRAGHLGFASGGRHRRARHRHLRARPIRCAGRPGRRAPEPRRCSRVRRACSRRAMSRCCKAAWPACRAAGPAAKTTGKAAAIAWWTSSRSGC